MIYDGCIGQYDYVQENVPVVPFIKENAQFFGFDASYMSQIESLHKSCGYDSFLSKYLTFPPPGLQPSVSSSNLGECDIFDSVNEQATEINSCFNSKFSLNDCACDIPKFFSSSAPKLVGHLQLA
jgi:carboxypeptidase D